MARTPRALLVYWTLPVRMFYLTLILCLLVALMLGLWVIGVSDSAAEMLLGLGEALVGFSGAVFLVFKYRDEVRDVEELAGSD